jgi:hypothetical protein
MGIFYNDLNFKKTNKFNKINDDDEKEKNNLLYYDSIYVLSKRLIFLLGLLYILMSYLIIIYHF